MQQKKTVDVLNDLMVEMLLQRDSNFVKSLLKQYHEIGGLSKKQLQGLLAKAKQMNNLPPNWVATLEAEILKKPTRYKSALPETKPLYEKDERIGQLINSILAQYPEHKRVLYFQSKFDNNETLTAAEISELERFKKLFGLL
jgi:hypothetical protein